MAEPISFVKACMDFFGKGDFGRKVEVPEFKALTWDDRVEIREMLIAEGYNILPLHKPAEASFGE